MIRSCILSRPSRIAGSYPGALCAFNAVIDIDIENSHQSSKRAGVLGGVLKNGEDWSIIFSKSVLV